MNSKIIPSEPVRTLNRKFTGVLTGFMTDFDLSTLKDGMKLYLAPQPNRVGSKPICYASSLPIETPTGLVFPVRKEKDLAHYIPVFSQPQPVKVESEEANNAFNYELLAMELASKQHDDIHQLIYEGYPPEPWGEVWQKYKGEAKNLISMVSKYITPQPDRVAELEAKVTQLEALLTEQYQADKALYESAVDITAAEHEKLLNRHDASYKAIGEYIEAMKGEKE